ncbi:hypothetical protein L6452_34416 [Arctium lappa]|uniref:Uncharacterized protein n=1 Tax=Arctium lappa TaxID=4217 RepID=A0ACB8YMD1_ARCLA|nr:hypothetical protein L6452_34416 [Arctium lappa]
MSTDVVRKAFLATEEKFLSLVESQWLRSPGVASIGSCCLVGIICHGMLYAANAGDSRAVLAREEKTSNTFARGGSILGLAVLGLKSHFPCKTGDFSKEMPMKKMLVFMGLYSTSWLKLHVTLWDAFAEQFNEYVSIHKDEGLVVVVIQFAMVKIYREKPSLSNSFNGTRLYINSEIDEIKDFRNSLLGLSGESKSSQQLTMLSGLSYSYREDFLDNNSKANIVEISEAVEHGDLEMFPEDLNVLLDRKFAIKIEVNNYNIKNSCFVYGISKLNDNENILNELEIRFSAQRPAKSDSVNVLSPDFGSVEKLKHNRSLVSQEKTYQKKTCKSVDLKRDFDEIYDVDDAMKGYATKSTKTCIPIDKEEVVTNLIIPKLEK